MPFVRDKNIPGRGRVSGMKIVPGEWWRKISFLKTFSFELHQKNVISFYDIVTIKWWCSYASLINTVLLFSSFCLSQSPSLFQLNPLILWHLASLCSARAVLKGIGQHLMKVRLSLRWKEVGRAHCGDYRVCSSFLIHFFNACSNFQCSNQQGEGLQRTLSLAGFYYLQTL